MQKKFVIGFAMIISVVCLALAEPAEKTKAQIFVEQMGIGINLGNTFESCGSWIKGGVTNYETGWGSPVITQDILEGYVKAGFKTLRIPVAWSNMMSNDGTFKINQNYLARVQQVVDWALDCGLYVILNEHWDGGWWENFPTKKSESMKRYKSIWNTLTKTFKDYDEHLIFESLNEEGGWDSVWNKYGGTTGKDKSYNLLNEINQTFVNIVRKSGGKNKERLLLIAGYQTDIEHTCDPFFKMPNDPSKMCAVSVHYYEPSTFAILEEDAAWGKCQKSWGSAKEMSVLAGSLKKMKTTFVDKGIPVIIGEYGCPKKRKDPESVQKYLIEVCSRAYQFGMCPVLWDIQTRGTNDDPFLHYDRKTCKMVDSFVEAEFKIIAATER